MADVRPDPGSEPDHTRPPRAIHASPQYGRLMDMGRMKFRAFPQPWQTSFPFSFEPNTRKTRTPRRTGAPTTVGTFPPGCGSVGKPRRGEVRIFDSRSKVPAASRPLLTGAEAWGAALPIFSCPQTPAWLRFRRDSPASGNRRGGRGGRPRPVRNSAPDRSRSWFPFPA